MSRHPSSAYKIVEAADWAEAREAGVFEGSTVDRADGYIHLSTRDQLEETARRHYAGQDDLRLLLVDLTGLGGAVVWEPSRDGALFPHIYGPLPVQAVIRDDAFAVGDDGGITSPWR
ncbi:DUF952 domain-containing protein [Brevundimonas sp.]|uniref:DUF952 domain-containing protein n=1 Tax=Brevundimonas sp. TaxID=1871086 RepID=UPI0035B184BF